MIGALASIGARLFGTEKATEKLIDNTVSLFDKIAYTSEEKAEDAAKDRSEARKMIVEWMKATSGQNLSRRFIALFVTGIWGTEHMIAMILSAISPWFKTATSANLLKSSELIGQYANTTNGAMMLVLAFYFAAPHMGSIVKGAMERFGGKNPK